MILKGTLGGEPVEIPPVILTIEDMGTGTKYRLTKPLGEELPIGVAGELEAAPGKTGN